MKISFLLFCFLSVAIAVNSQTIKMKIATITPTDGEVVSALEFSDTTASSIGSGGGSGTGVTRFEFVKIKKPNALSTNELFKRSLIGTTLPEVDFEYYDAGGTLFYKIVIKSVVLTHFSYLSPECSNCTSLSHQVWFDFSMIEVTDVATGNVLKYNRATRTFY